MFFVTVISRAHIAPWEVHYHLAHTMAVAGTEVTVYGENKQFTYGLGDFTVEVVTDLDAQSIAMRALRADGRFPGVGGREKRTGELLCEYIGMPEGDYLRIGVNGEVLNPQHFPLAHEVIERALDELN